MNKKLTSLAMAIAIVGTSVSPAIASEDNKKEEVVYINTKEDGDVEEMNVVNIFSKGKIVDYGDYEEVKLLNSNNTIENNKGEVQFQADKDRTYYQGRLKNNQSPWNIDIQYYLNNKEIAPKDITGKSGKIKIRIKINENTSVKNDYFDNYALQVNTKLDTEKTENIIADGATVANEGSNKLITYTALAGKGLDKEITFDANDFSYPGFSINAIKLSLDVDIDEGDIDSKINELIDASKKLNDGSNELNNKSDDLRSASSSLNEGMENLSRGNIDFSKGVDTLYESISTVQNGLTSLNNKSESLVSGSSQVQNALNELEKSLNNIPADSNNIPISPDGINELSKASSDIRDGIKTLDKSLSMASNATDPKNYQYTLKNKGLDQEKLRYSNDKAIAKIDESIKLLKQQLALVELNDASENTKNVQNKDNNNKNIPSKNPSSSDKNNKEDSTQIDDKKQELPQIEENKQDSQKKDENINSDELKKEIPIENEDNIENNQESENIKINFTTAIKTSNQNADMIKQQIYMLENTKKLLQANNANIDGTNVYFKQVNDLFNQIKDGSDKLNTNYEQFDKEIQNISSILTELKTQSKKLSDAIKKLSANYKLLDQGIISYTSGLAKIERGNMQILKGVEDLSTANSKLVKGSNDLRDGTNKLNDGINQYTEGVGKLNNGINEFYNETSGMDKDLNKKIDEIKKSLGDKNTPTKSFSSDKNGEIKSLQFVIQTEKIEKEEEKNEDIKEEKEDKNFIEKFKNLFK